MSKAKSQALRSKKGWAKALLEKHGVYGVDSQAAKPSSMEGLAMEASKHGYRKPRSASGSTGRYFHGYLHKQAKRDE